MEETIAYCGLVCRTCPIYLATRQEDPKKKLEMRAEIARKIEEVYGQKGSAEDIGEHGKAVIEREPARFADVVDNSLRSGDV